MFKKTIVLLFSVNKVVFGLDDDESAERKDFVSKYLDKMEILVELRLKTETARVENNNLSKEIKKTLTNPTRTEQKNKIAQVKQIQLTNKGLLAQAKTYASKRIDVRKQWQQAVKNKDTSTMATLKNSIEELTTKIEDIRAQITTNRATIAPLMSEVKTYRDSNKTKIETVEPLFTQIKMSQTKINSEITDKDKLWLDFKTKVKEKNYSQAITILDNIISSKQLILEDIKSKNIILNNILTIQNS